MSLLPHFTDEYPDQPEPSCDKGHEAVEQELPESILLPTTIHHIYVHIAPRERKNREPYLTSTSQGSASEGYFTGKRPNRSQIERSLVYIESEQITVFR
jgi:hypothetical protein